MSNQLSLNTSCKMHSVEKIGGTSMSQPIEVLKNIWLRPSEKESNNNEQIATLYQRIFVVSAYSGMTNALLEHKKTGEPGVYALFAEMDSEHSWSDKLAVILHDMKAFNHNLFGDNQLSLKRCNQFIEQRFSDVEECLVQLESICKFGHFQLTEHLHRVREMLSSLGELHSAFNSVELLRLQGINAKFVDLTNWYGDDSYSLEELIEHAFSQIDLEHELPIVTGYARCKEGLMRTYDRGYSEMTFSKIATVTQASHAIIHKEYHLSTADPLLVGVDQVRPIGRTNYDVADQLANLGMEAIHPSAAAGLRRNNIQLVIKNTFEPDHQGTGIDADYQSEKPKVEIIAGSKNVWALEMFDQEMVGDAEQSYSIHRLVSDTGMKILTKDYNANTVTFYLKGNKRDINSLVTRCEKEYPHADITVEKLSLVSVIGSDMRIPGLLGAAATALSEANVNILAVHQAMRQIDMMFIVSEQDYGCAIAALHKALIETSQETTSKTCVNQ